MKVLLLVRHAKSSWDLDIDDFDRELNPRGKSDAPDMAEKLIKKEIEIDLFVSSPAKRAMSTAAFFTEFYNKKSKDILSVSSLYEPTITAFYDAIENLDDNLETVALFSHNPTITEFANQLTSIKIDDMPTCAVFAVKADAEKWKDFSAARKEFWFFDYPKNN